MKARLSRYLPVLIIVLGIAVRLRNVDLPPYDAHSWRQTETAALARNYATEGYQLFYPRVDWRGDTPGYIESELSIYAFTVALAYGVFGISETVAHLVAITAWTTAAVLLYLIGRRALGRRAALFALCFFTFLSPFSIYFGRTIMGDMTALMFVLLAVYATLRYQEHERWPWLALTVAGAALAGLSKLPSLYVGVPIAAMILQREGLRAVLRPRYWVATVCAVGPVAAWYWHAYLIGQQTGLTFEILARSDQKVARLNLLLDLGFYKALWLNFTWRLMTTTGVGLAVLGILLPRRKPFEIAMIAWVVTALAYFLFAARGVLVQDYYTLALLPPAVWFIGKAADAMVGLASEWARRSRPVFRLGAAALAVLWTAGLFYAGTEAAASADQEFAPVEAIVQLRQSGRWIQATVPTDGGLVTLGSGQPEGLYFSNRHGMWIYGNGHDVSMHRLSRLAAGNWKYLAVFTPYWGNVDAEWLRQVHAEHRLLGGGGWFLVYDISQPDVTQPPHGPAVPPVWGDQISLQGYALTPDRLIDGRLHTILYWRAEQAMSGPYTGFIHVMNAAGTWCGQDDHQPLHGLYGQEGWQPGQVVADPFQIDVTGCPGEREFNLNIGLYHPDTGERLPISFQPSETQLYSVGIRLEH